MKVAPTLAEVLAEKKTGLVVYAVDKRYYTRVICGGCPDCQHLHEDGTMTREYPHYQTPPEEIRQ